MNLKEAFRYQNKLQELITTTQGILNDESNIVKVTHTTLKSKVDSTEIDDVTFNCPHFSLFDLSMKVTLLADFLMHLLDQKKILSMAIQKAKAKLPIDLDVETAINAKRQNISKIFSKMASLRNSEVTLSKSGYAYKFNAQGDQVSYKCDVRTVKTINFDRNKIKSYLKQINAESDRISSKLDVCLVTSNVEYTEPFDINDGFADIFDSFCSGR